MNQLVTSSTTEGVAGDIPLVVDLDGTLIRSDLLLESVFALAAHQPSRLLNLAGWMMRGKACVKAMLASLVDLASEKLPFNDEMLSFVMDERAKGRRIYLASASDQRFVRAVADQLGVFDGIFASDGIVNLKGSAKANKLVAEFGIGGFDYAGDARADLAVWQSARQAIAVNCTQALLEELKANHTNVHTLAARRVSLLPYARAMRLHQWAKNLLLVLPALAAHAFTMETFAILALAFLSFGLIASAVYLTNDLLDLKHDRDHPTKRFRPLACGAIPLSHGVILALLLFTTGLGLAWIVSLPYLGVMLLYMAVTFSYSLYLKRKPIVDVLTLAGLYTVRIIAGAAAVALPLSPWMLGFCMFLFLSLALVKRYTELRARAEQGRGDPSGRGYRLDDMPVLLALGGSAGYSAVVVLALYVNSPATAVLYARPEGLWLVCALLLYWISRIMLVTHRGGMHDDPLVFALKDRISLLTACAIIAVVGTSSF